MKTLKMCVIVICSTFLVFGCASFPEPNKENQTLVIGKIIQHGTGYRFYGSVSVNGTNKFGIQITLQELISGQAYTMRTRSDGMFFSVNIPEGEYKITRIYLRKKSGSAWASMTWVPRDSDEYRLEIVNGKVNNFGSTSWECESGVKNSMFYNREYEQVRDSFQENNRSSNWNEREWVNINIKREIL